MIGLVAAVVLAAVALAAPLAQAVACPDNTNKDAHECLLNNNKMCWDVKDGNLKPGELVYLYNKNKAQADGWANGERFVSSKRPFTIRPWTRVSRTATRCSSSRRSCTGSWSAVSA